MGPQFLTLLSLTALRLTVASDPSSPEIDRWVNQAKEKALASSRQWHALLHYEPRAFGGATSRADGAGFFLASSGRSDPEAELEADLRSFFVNAQARCQFPARLEWLSSELGFELPKSGCPDFDEFRERLQAQSVALVFSSYHAGSPASAFGHAFLRLNRAPDPGSGKPLELLDYGVGYAATADSSNPLVFAAKGLTGGFRGEFTIAPYYYKVREYNDFESRDLWEYHLSLSKPQVERLVAHLWELRSTYFNYWFLDENCSYQALSLLEVAAPELDLASSVGAFMLPAESIKRVNAVPGLVSDIRYRPSIQTQFATRLDGLSDRERHYLKEISRNPEANLELSELSDAEKSRVLDAAVDWIDFRYGKELLTNQSNERSAWRHRLLVARSRISQASRPRVPEVGTSGPHLGHGSSRTSVEGGYSPLTGGFMRLGVRAALHDYLDPAWGHPRTLNLEILSIQTRMNLERSPDWVEELKLIEAQSNFPLSNFERSWSWRALLGAKTLDDNRCDRCIAGVLAWGAGISSSPFHSLPFDYALLFDLETNISPVLDRFGVNLGAGPLAKMRAYLTPSLQGAVTGEYHYFVFSSKPHHYSFGAELRFGFLTNFALNLRFQQSVRSWDSSLGFFRYF